MKSVVPYNSRRLFNLLLGQLPSLVSFITVIVIGFLLIISLRVHFSLQEKLEIEKNETGRIKLRKQILEKSTQLIKSELDSANKFFSSLIPDTEDFFSIIYALETISQKSGFVIKEYSINLGTSTKEKLSISVSGTGDPNTFVKFLDSYSFSGGRFATSEKIEFSSSQFKATKIQLNFYSKKIMISTNIVPELKKSDITYLNEIKQKISFDFIGNESEASLSSDFNYETKSNPF